MSFTAENPPRVIALIPARAGSKRIANKNVRLLAGHPLLAYTICAAREAGVFDRVIVSTDSADIAAIARHYGADVPFLRSAEYAADKSPDIEWLAHLLGKLREAGELPDAFALLRPTSPFRQPATIRRAWRTFLDAGEVDSLRAIEKCRQYPGKMWRVAGNRMTPLMQKPEGEGGAPWHSTPYQALPPVYIQNASLEIAWTSVVLDKGSITGEGLTPFITEGHEGFDLNDPYDWIVAEHLANSGDAKLPAVDVKPYVIG